MKKMICFLMLLMGTATAFAGDVKSGIYADPTLDWIYNHVAPIIAPNQLYGKDKVQVNLQGRRIDRIVIRKAKREMTLMHKGVEVRWYKISLGANPTGQKMYEGDKRTPEGVYKIDKKQNSNYYLALRISYPTREQEEFAAKSGKSAGGMIMIHGIKNGFGWVGQWQRMYDWTIGCVAVTNEEIDEIYNHVSAGTAVEILP